MNRLFKGVLIIIGISMLLILAIELENKPNDSILSNDSIDTLQIQPAIVQEMIQEEMTEDNTFSINRIYAEAEKLVKYKHNDQQIDDTMYMQEIPMSDSSSGAFECTARLYNSIKVREFIYDDSNLITMWCKADSSGIIYHKIVFYKKPINYESPGN